MELISDDGFRQDGRKADDLRRIECRLGVYRQADGSAYLEQGFTKVLVAVYGPHEPRGRLGGGQRTLLTDRARINCQYSMATFSTGERKIRPRGDRRSREFTSHLEKTFEAAILTTSYPNSQIDIYCEILQSDGGNLSACINAATLALIDAGVSMRDYVCSCTSSFYNETTLMDVNHQEETASSGNVPLVTLALLPKTDEIVLFELDSRLHSDHLENIIESTMKGCKDVFAILDSVVRKHVAESMDKLAVGYN